MTYHRVSLPTSIVKQHALDVIRRKMPPIQLQIAGQHTTPFPKDRSRLKSFYEYRSRSPHRDRRGRLCGGAVRLVATLFDFTFVRSIFAPIYSARGGHCYDPASLFVLLVLAFVSGYEHISNFVTDLHDPDHPRLVAEIIRGTPEREKVKGLRSPSESINSYAQHCTGLKAPCVRGDKAFFARAHLSILALLLRKVVHFIADMTNLLRRIPAGQERLAEPPPQTPRQRRLKRWLWRLLYDET